MNTSQTDPIALFRQERASAREAGDPMANLCNVANVDAQGQAQVRTLVLREVDGQLAIFVNATSPKWVSLQQGFAMQTFWPSVNVQYRFAVDVAPVGTEIVAESWLLRPQAPQRMDWFYAGRRAQSSEIESRDALLSELGELALPEPLAAPEGARGLIMQPTQVERLDLNQANGVHDRRVFHHTSNGWDSATLVP